MMAECGLGGVQQLNEFGDRKRIMAQKSQQKGAAGISRGAADGNDILLGRSGVAG